MNSLRLLANVVKANNSGLNFVTKQNQIWYLERANIKFSTAAALIRNATTTNISQRTDSLNSCSTFGIHEEGKPTKYDGILLSHHLQGTSKLSGILCWRQSHRGFSTKSCPDRANKSDTKSAAVADTEADLFGEASKLGLFARFKLMYKMYWYVLIPVHVVTSAGWIGGFYYLSQSGVDVPALLQYMHLSETIIEKVQGSSLGHWAVAYLCYKVATPLRYAVTLGGTTVSIKYLVQQGYIKPMPTKAQIMQMYEDKKAQRAADKANKDNAPDQPSEQK